MVNAWSLAYDVLNGTLEEEYPIMSEKDKSYYEYDRNDPTRKDPFPKNESYDDFENPLPEQSVNFTSSKVTEAKSQKEWQDFWKDDGISLTGNPGPYDYYGAGGAFSYAGTPISNNSPDTISITGSRLKGGMGNDHITFNPPSVQPDTRRMFVDDTYAYHFPPTESKPSVNFTDESNRKYKEDESIKDLKDYVASTYSGHYTSKNNNVQTLDLIQSVGDAESFCRSNAIKYLSRYDKKGQAKRDILKAMHYCLLLYYFSGNQTNDETPTRGYETF